jgi:LmbE family N-acetylglucosaminyl deacetylase
LTTEVQQISPAPTSVSLTPATLTGPVWVIAPHPDDESLGVGALMAELSDLGTEVWALLLTDGGASHPGSAEWPRERLAAQRLSEWHAALDLLGVAPDRRAALGLPDGALPFPDDGGEAAVALIRHALAGAPPATVLLPWRRDPHPDHRAAHALMMAALGSWPLARRLEYAVWLPERGGPDERPRPGEAQCHTAVLPQQRSRKEAAVRAHRSQLGRLIRDDPGGFTLPEEMIGRALDSPETLLEVKR